MPNTVNGQNITSYLGVRAPTPPNMTIAVVDPTVNSYKGAQLGDYWYNRILQKLWFLEAKTATSGTWALLSLSAGALSQLTGDTGTAVPSGGSIKIAGTANQITTTASASTVTLSLPSAITTPGSLTTTTSLTATNGNITATLGNVVINGAAKQLQVHGGAATDFIGTTTLVNGVSPDILNTNIAATDRIFIVRTAANASTAFGSYDYEITASTKFVITAHKADTTTETGDLSTVAYFIVRQV